MPYKKRANFFPKIDHVMRSRKLNSFFSNRKLRKWLIYAVLIGLKPDTMSAKNPEGLKNLIDIKGGMTGYEG